MGASSVGHAQTDAAASIKTRTPIKHVIIIIGENRSFDHVFGLYRPRPGEMISNLLSQGILAAGGAPGPNFARAGQFRADPQPGYYIGATVKTTYDALPPPELYGTPKEPPFASGAATAAAEPALEPSDLALLATGASGLGVTRGLDPRITNGTRLPNGPFRFTGPDLPYDAYHGDTVHRFFQMWQQSDCSLAFATAHNPSGCLNDLYPFVAVNSSATNRGGGNSMAVHDMGAGDAPLLKQLADDFTSSDNFHQAVMGGTGPNHIMLGTGDALFWSDGQGHPLPPPETVGVADPNPKPGSDIAYIADRNWTNCADARQPGVGPILAYLAALKLSSKCEPGHFYMINNSNPAFLPNGVPDHGPRAVPPLSLRTIGDALSEKHISHKYYGGGYNAAVRVNDGSTDPADRAAGGYCAICNFLAYGATVMADPAQRAAHIGDVVDFFGDIANSTLPAVAFVKPDELLDGHPATSKLDLFEAMVKNILNRLRARPALEAETAVFIVFDEGGGYYDSGYIQPLDFFGDGVRIPFIVVSPFSRGGHVVHTYYDHASILKFIERNWRLKPLTARSRDNLPNPRPGRDPYVPRNRPAIGDLFEMFDFSRGGRGRDRR